MKKIVVFLILILTLYFYFNLSKPGILPDSFLYRIDKLFEWVNYNFLTYTDEGKIRLRIRFLEERSAEFESLKSKGKLTEKIKQQLEDDYLNNLISLYELTKEVKDPDRVLQIKSEITEITNNHKKTVQYFLEKGLEKRDKFLNESYKKISDLLLLP